MVDALREAWRVLTPHGVLIDVRPVTAPMDLEVAVASRAIWTTQVNSASAAEDAAADAAVETAVANQWFAFVRRQPFDLEVLCDTAADLKLYVQKRKLREAEIPFEELSARLRELGGRGQTAYLRCRRPWMLSVYHRR